MYGHVFIRCKLLSSDLETMMILQINDCENIRVWLHAIGSERTRRIYRLITENIEITVQREYFAFVFLLNKVYVIKHFYHGYPCYITFISHKNDVIIIVKLHRATRLRLVAQYKSLTMIMTPFLLLINVI